MEEDQKFTKEQNQSSEINRLVPVAVTAALRSDAVSMWDLFHIFCDVTGKVANNFKFDRGITVYFVDSTRNREKFEVC